MKLGLMSGAFGAKLKIDIDIIRHVDTMLIGTNQPEALELVAEELL